MSYWRDVEASQRYKKEIYIYGEIKGLIGFGSNVENGLPYLYLQISLFIGYKKEIIPDNVKYICVHD